MPEFELMRPSVHMLMRPSVHMFAKNIEWLDILTEVALSDESWKRCIVEVHNGAYAGPNQLKIVLSLNILS